MNTPEDAAARRSAAIEALQEKLRTQVSAMEHELYAGLLAKLQQSYEQPETLTKLFDEFNRVVQLPVLQQFGEAILSLVELNVSYHAAAQTAPAAALRTLRAPLEAWLRRQFGVAADGTLTPGGYLSQFSQDPTSLRTVQQYTYRALSSGQGLDAYRKGLRELIEGNPSGGEGLYQQAYSQAYDVYNQADRQLQGLAADRLGLAAALYQGALIAGSRPFCVARNNRVFLRAEIALFGTPEDTYGGYSDKATGDFSGKTEPYDPLTDCGGWNCRHQLHFLPNGAAIRLRPELVEKDGNLASK